MNHRLPITALRRPGCLRVLLCVALLLPAMGVMAAPARDAQQAPGTGRGDVALPVDSQVVAPPALPSMADMPVLPGEAASVETAATGEPPAPGRIQSVLQKALTLLGTPYRWGGADPEKGFDCSGLVGYVFRNALGIELPRVSRDMAKSGELVTDRAKLIAGDLVFFGLKGRINHVGIYLGEGRFLHAPSRGKDVTVSSLEKGYWSGRFLQARRVADGG